MLKDFVKITVWWFSIGLCDVYFLLKLYILFIYKYTVNGHQSDSVAMLQMGC